MNYVDEYAQLDEYARIEQERMDELLARIKAKLPELEKLFLLMGSNLGAEDGMYRFYCGSFKIWSSCLIGPGSLQAMAKHGFDLIQEIAGDEYQLNLWYLQIVDEGTPEPFELAFNNDWLNHARPVSEAFWHTRYFIGVMLKYGKELQEAPYSLPSGWAAILCLFNMW